MSPQVALRKAFSAFPTGVVAVCALVDERPVGMAVNSFTSISLDPPLVAVSVARTSSTWPTLATRGRLGMSVLGSEHEVLCRRLSARAVDRFEDAQWHATDDGAVLIDDAALWLECEVRSTFDGGDHEIVLMEVHEAETFPDVTPLVFHQSQFRELHADR
ncbi:flavin reductase family protein [Agromyces sp. NPDC058484]|uniref:flavin reductase family protein n=1 Tax=Agromyces sp. NPDC058484 TaxID=3346524 RepID=UPI003660DC1D